MVSPWIKFIVNVHLRIVPSGTYTRSDEQVSHFIVC